MGRLGKSRGRAARGEGAQECNPRTVKYGPTLGPAPKEVVAYLLYQCGCKPHWYMLRLHVCEACRCVVRSNQRAVLEQ